MTGAARYRRGSRCVFRALHNRGWVGGPGRSTIGIEGSALFVWLALEAESSVAELVSEIQDIWPELDTVRPSEVRDALDALMDHGVVEVSGHRRDPTDRL